MELPKNQTYFAENPIFWSFCAELYWTQYFPGQSRVSWTLHFLMDLALDSQEFVNTCGSINCTTDSKLMFVS